MGTKLNGQPFPREPIKTIWDWPRVGTRLNGRISRAARKTVTCELPHLTVEEYDFFYAQWISGGAGGFHDLIITAPGAQGTDNYLDISGVIITEVYAEEHDLDGFRWNAKIEFSRIRY